MEVSMSKHDEPPTIPGKLTVNTTPRQPPLLGVSSDYDIWKIRVMTCLRRVPTSEHFDYLLSYLDDEAAKRATANGFTACNSPPQNWKILDECFSLKVDTQQTAIQFLSRHQKPHESPIDYLHSLQQIATQAFPSLDILGREEITRSRFIEGLLPGALREHLLRVPPADTADLKRTALRFLTAERLSVPVATYRPTVMTVDEATEPNRQDSFQSAAAIREFRDRNNRRGQLQELQYL
ncbi:unnamed protein product [Schistosoma margrebowiei]|uniref:Uncharacterized protein n=1 Tax=Schistosoma margrebowiei TaxID=48269 RepID=A0AA84ZGA7_9TREM|nr:unnamed protein product [Schistosoma margrebowiei]